MAERKREKLLVIEDNATFLNMLKIRLELNGFEVVTSEDGMEGLSLARREMPDLIILDLSLPEIGENADSDASLLDRNMGHKICRMIKFDARLKNIPIVILTASDSSDDEKLAKSVGADAFVVKTTTETLLDTIRELIARNKSKLY